jgi:copper(I)-binding protein
VAVAVLLGTAAAGCGDDDTTASTATTGSVGSNDTAAPAIEITKAWARTSPSMATAGAAYFDITSGIDDVLVSVTVDASVAASAEIHETVPAEPGDEMSHDEMSDDEMSDGEMSDDEMSDGMDHSDTDTAMDTAMTMRELTDGLTLPAGETVSLAPGGYHIMLLGLVEPLVAGDVVSLELEFAHAPTQTVQVTVSDAAP